MSGTFAPRPGSAHLGRQVLAQARMESRLMIRNGEQLLLTVVIPMMALVGGTIAADRIGLDLDSSPIDFLAPGVIALAIMSTSFTSVAIATAFERRYGVIKRLGASPLPRHGLLLGKVGGLLIVLCLQMVLLGATALLMGWQPQVNVVGALASFALGVAAFASLGMFIAGVLRAEATLALANVVFLLMMTAGAIVIPPEKYGAASDVVVYLPSGALGEAMRAALGTGTVDWAALLVLAVWAILCTVLTTRTFRWE